MKPIASLLAVLLLCGCAAPAAAAPPQPETHPTVLTMPATAATTAPSQPPEPPEPPQGIVLASEAPGTLEERCADAVVDYSNTTDGYVMVQYLGQTDKRLKVLVKGPTTTYQYNLPAQDWTVFPLSDGDGNYQVGVYRNTSGSKYAVVLTAQFSVTLADAFAPFLRPNQYVDYAAAPNTVALGQTLCTGIQQPLEKVAAIYDYVVENFTYDDDLAATVKSGYLPVLDQVLERKQGICFDYAAVMTAMLRSQQVPCKLVVGYAGEIYHAWISVWTEEDGWVDGVIFFDGNSWKRMDPTFASSGNRSEEIMRFIENNSNYTIKYLY